MKGGATTMKKITEMSRLVLASLMIIAATAAMAQSQTVTITLKNGTIKKYTSWDSIRYVGGEWNTAGGIGVKIYTGGSTVSDDYLYSQMDNFVITTPVVTVAPPVITPNGGTITGPTTVTITAETGATIYYTTDGTYPTSSATALTATTSVTLTVTQTTTIRAIAMKHNYFSSETMAKFTWQQAADNNVNANWNIAGSNIPKGKADPTFTNQSTDDYAWRLEYPHINTASGNQRVVKAMGNYGITYSLEWDNNKIANRWTCYTMCSKNNANNVSRSDDFKSDEAVTTSPTNKYTQSSTYSRGHLCPSADRLASTNQNKQTFYMTNMQPQYQDHNGGMWATLEKYVRTKWQPTNNTDTLYVIKAATIENVTLNGTSSTGIITTTTDDGGHVLPVPKYFYMAFLYYNKTANSYKAFALWTEQKTSNNESANSVITNRISIDELERRTGIDFFCNLPDDIEATVEATASYWDFSGND